MFHDLVFRVFTRPVGGRGQCGHRRSVGVKRALLVAGVLSGSGVWVLSAWDGGARKLGWWLLIVAAIVVAFMVAEARGAISCAQAPADGSSVHDYEKIDGERWKELGGREPLLGHGLVDSYYRCVHCGRMRTRSALNRGND